MPSPFTASLLDGDEIVVGNATFEYVQASNLLKKQAPAGGGPVEFAISIVQNTASLGVTVPVNRTSGFIDFTSGSVTIAATVDGISTTHSVVGSDTLSVSVPGSASTGPLKVLEITISYTGGSTSATDTLTLIDGLDLTYVSEGDQNGLVYFYGTARNTTAFSNPSGTRVLTFQSSDDGTKVASNATDRALSEASTGNFAGSWWAIALNDGESLLATHLVVRSQNSANTRHPRNWLLQGTLEPVSSIAQVNSAFWDTILTVTNDPFTAINQYKNYVLNSSNAYRAFRLIQTNTDTSSTNYSVWGEVELYGTLSPNPAPPVDPSTAFLRVTTEGAVPYNGNIVRAIARGSSGATAAAGSPVPPSAGLRNGKQISNHTAGGFFDIMPDVELLSGTNWSIFVAARVISDSIIMGSTSPNNQYRVYPSGANNIFIFTGQTSVQAPQNLTTPLGSWGLWCITFNQSQLEFFEWVPGSPGSMQSRGTATQSGFSFFIRTLGGVFTARDFDFGETEIHLSVLNSSQINTVAQRMAATWGL